MGGNGEGMTARDGGGELERERPREIGRACLVQRQSRSQQNKVTIKTPVDQTQQTI